MGARNARRRRNACRGKLRHATIEAARRHRVELYRTGRAKPGTLNVYECGWCGGGYHVGHNRRERAA